MASPEEQAIQGVIDQIWSTYDVDNSGELDKEETKKFVQDTLGNLGSGDEFSTEAFDEVFATFDKDGSGNIDKAEMVTFIKQLLSGWAVILMAIVSSRSESLNRIVAYEWVHIYVLTSLVSDTPSLLSMLS